MDFFSSAKNLDTIGGILGAGFEFVLSSPGRGCGENYGI
jgi:hypothetical protein